MKRNEEYSADHKRSNCFIEKLRDTENTVQTIAGHCFNTHWT